MIGEINTSIVRANILTIDRCTNRSIVIKSTIEKMTVVIPNKKIEGKKIQTDTSHIDIIPLIVYLQEFRLRYDANLQSTKSHTDSFTLSCVNIATVGTKPFAPVPPTVTISLSDNKFLPW